MKLQKYSILQFGFIIIFGLMVAACKPLTSRTLPESSSPSNQKEQTAQVVLNFGDDIATYSAALQPSLSALSALTQVASASGRQVSVKTYSFGSLVESIDTYANTADKAWIYFVNNQAASVGADAYVVQPADLIEWRYTKPE